MFLQKTGKLIKKFEIKNEVEATSYNRYLVILKESYNWKINIKGICGGVSEEKKSFYETHITKVIFLFTEYVDRKCDSLNDTFRIKWSSFIVYAHYCKIIYLLNHFLSLYIF